MPFNYPDEIIHQLVTKYSLAPEYQVQLRTILIDEEVQIVAKAMEFDLELFLIPIPATTDFYIPIPSAAIFILKNREYLEQLRAHISASPTSMAQYLALREQINTVATIKTRVEKVLLLRTISGGLQLLYNFIMDDPILRYEIPRLPRVLALHLNAELIWLQGAATLYFQSLFDKTRKTILDYGIEFLPKRDGVQLGNRMSIRYRDEHGVEQRVIFYIKTHQYGSLRAGGSTTTTVDPKELFFYKVLEYSGFGPKVHFFFNPLSPSGFFIATQDEGFTKILGKIKFFETYSQAERSQLAPSPTRGDTAAEIGMVRAEVLLRVFNLWDITTNSGNFGRVIVKEQSEKWRVIDFRVNTQESYVVDQIFEDFRDGVGMDGLDPSGTFLTAVLSTTSAKDRIQLTAPLIEGFELGKCHYHSSVRHLPLSAAVEKAHREVAAYLVEHHEALLLSLEKLERSQDDLTRYIQAVQGNLKQFVDGLHYAVTELSKLSVSV